MIVSLCHSVGLLEARGQPRAVDNFAGFIGFRLMWAFVRVEDPVFEENSAVTVVADIVQGRFQYRLRAEEHGVVPRREFYPS